MFELLAARAGGVHVCGHRGHSSGAPENTLPAIKRATELGASSCEIDVVLSKDGEIVVLHDLTLDRTTDGAGLASDRVAADIARLDAGSWFGREYRGASVPLLRDLLIFVADRKIGLHIEIKEYQNEDALIDRLGVELAETGTADWVVIISFDHQQLLKVKERIPGIRTEGITHARHVDPGDLVRQGRLDSISVELPRFRPEDAAPIHAAGAAIRCHLPKPDGLDMMARHGWNVREMVGAWIGGGLVDSVSGDDVAYLRALVDDFPLNGAG